MAEGSKKPDSKKHGNMGQRARGHSAPAMRTRIYLPGKYIVVFGLLPVLIIAGAVGSTLIHNNRYQPTVVLEHRQNALGERQAYYPLPELLIDLSPDHRGRTAFMKTVPAIAIINAKDASTLKLLDSARPLITERVTLFLRSLRPEDFQSTEQLNRIKRELTRRVNLGAGQEVARDVILEQLVIQ